MDMEESDSLCLYYLYEGMGKLSKDMKNFHSLVNFYKEKDSVFKCPIIFEHNIEEAKNLFFHFENLKHEKKNSVSLISDRIIANENLKEKRRISFLTKNKNISNNNKKKNLPKKQYIALNNESLNVTVIEELSLTPNMERK